MTPLPLICMSLLKAQMMDLTLRICMIMGELVMELILHILMFSPLIFHIFHIFHIHLLLLGTGLMTSQPGYLHSLLNLLPLLKSVCSLLSLLLIKILFLLLLLVLLQGLLFP
jgi:hypothetical protein